MSDKEHRFSQDRDFAPEIVDEQIGQVSSLHSAHGRQLVQDLQHGYQEYKNQNERSLERVWQRLGQSTGVAHEETPGASADDSTYREGNIAPLHTLTRSSRWSQTPRSLGLLAAVVLIVILVGSTIVVFHHAQPVTGSEINNGDTTTRIPKSIYIVTEEANNEWQISSIDRVTHKIAWKYNAGISAQYTTLQNNTIYATSSSDGKDGSAKYLSAINAQTGKLRWRITTPPDLRRSFVTDPMFHQSGFVTNDYGYIQKVIETYGIVFAIAEGGHVFAFRAQDGKLVWSTTLNIQVDKKNRFTFDLSVYYAGIYIAGRNHLFALSPGNGKLLWTTQIAANEVFNQMQIAGNSLYIGALDTTGHNTNRVFNNDTLVFAFSTYNGHKLWQHDFKSWTASPPTLADGVIYVSTYDGNVHALNASTGSEIWKYYPGSRVNLGQPIVSDGVIYVNDSGDGSMLHDNTMRSAIIALNLRGKLLWWVNSDTVKTNIDVYAAANGIVYGGKDPRQLIAYDARSGKVIWQQMYNTTRLIAVMVVPEP